MNASQEKRTVPRSDSLTGSQLGMTLIEILVALGILAAVAVVFLLGMSTSSKAVMVSQKNVAAESLAKSQMENTKAQQYQLPPYPTPPYSKIAIPQDLANQGYDVAIVAEPLHPPDDGIQRITVTVTRNGETAFTLVGYKVK
ncbi:MAG: type II secretion system protein [Chloroflexi bacterium]|nr:type II secretion system protein [Chloroflexota bacterium]